jgi:tetratricopeptide (TPR) repeat protein
LSDALGLLEVAGLIRRQGADPEPKFAFRHALLRETAYGSLLHEERKVLHRAVGSAIERVFPNANGELASVLAHHYLAGDENDKALTYLRKAGDEAARVYALEEALDHFRRALQLAVDGHGQDDDIVYLYERRGRMLELAGRYEEAIANYRELETLGRERSQPAMELRGLARQATLHAIPSAVIDREQGRALSNRTLEMARELEDPSMQSLGLWNLMRVEELGGDYHAARENGERALALIESVDLPEQKAFILNDLSGIYLSTANFARGREVNLQAIDLWKQLDNLPMLVDAYSNQVSIHLLKAEFDEATRMAKRAADLSDEIDNVWGKSYSRYMIYWVHADRGDFALALATARECVHFAEQAGFVVPSIQTEADIGLMHAMMGEFEEAHKAIDRAIANATEHFPEWLIQPQTVKALVLTLERRLEEAEALLDPIEEASAGLNYVDFSYFAFVRALVLPEFWIANQDWARALADSQHFLDLFDHMGLRFMKYDLLLMKGIALLGMGRVDEAHLMLEEGLLLAETVGSQRCLWRLHDALAATARKLRDETGSVDHKRRARDVLMGIAASTESREQRDAFLRLTKELSLTLKED